ncbi:MAG TPA: flagellar hook basal-body protein [Bryobacteraceae bacterium]|nr:flagellar hook basal-body protein [Bryobacteraceae bacterium]
MDALTISAASGMRALIEALDMSANNLANANTAGFKTDREFFSLYVSPDAQAFADGTGSLPTTVPVIEKQYTDFAQGLLVRTGNLLDLALSGKGFFTVNGPSGPLYTRSGNFKLSAQGLLVTHEGYPLRTPDNTLIQTQSSSPLNITSEGEVLQDGQSLGKLHLVEFSDTSGLVKQGNNYFRLADGNVKPAPAVETQVEQGKLENSNVSSAGAAVRLVGVMRQFEMLQKAITLSGDMSKQALQEVARVGS